MNQGDLVWAFSTKDAYIRIGIIIKKILYNNNILDVYQVLTEDGTLDVYTTAALRVLSAPFSLSCDNND